MFLPLLFLCLGLANANNKTENNDLQTIGSGNHFNYQPSVRTHDIPQVAEYYQPTPIGITRKNYEDKIAAPIINYPVKIVQKFKDQNGNIRIVTSYKNKDDTPLPMRKYKDQGMRKQISSKPHVHHIPGNQPTMKTIVESSHAAPLLKSTGIVQHQSPFKATGYSDIDPRRVPKKMEYSSSKTIKFPSDDDEEIVTNQHEATVRDGSASSYNHRSSFISQPKNPQVHTKASLPVRTKGKELVQPLQGAGSTFVSNIDDGLIDEDGHNGGGDGGTVFHPGHHGGDGGEIDYPHGGGGGNGFPGGGGGGYGGNYPREREKSHAYGHEESKGDKGENKHKTKEIYEKGHSEKHGHEEHKGGKKEESGEKTGHLDETNIYSKGHHTTSGGKAQAIGNSKGHKKGHKTKGFHTVHHKDEYKKDEIFYDEEHDNGHQNGRGHDQSTHQHIKGGNWNKGHLNSGYKDAKKGYKGSEKGGEAYEYTKGYSNSEGENSHRGHHSQYGRGSEQQSERGTHGRGGKGYY